MTDLDQLRANLAMQFLLSMSDTRVVKTSEDVQDNKDKLIDIAVDWTDTLLKRLKLTPAEE